MKRILLTMMCFVVLSVNSVSYAYVDKHIDSFDESTAIFSYNRVTSVDRLRFMKEILVNKSVKYSILLTSDVRSKDYMYSQKDSQIKIDRYISNMKILNTTYMHYDFSNDDVNSEAELLSEHIEKLKVAKKVSLRFYHENGLVNTIDIPDDVLAEWKEVINTTE